MLQRYKELYDAEYLAGVGGMGPRVSQVKLLKLKGYFLCLSLFWGRMGCLEDNAVSFNRSK